MATCTVDLTRVWHTGSCMEFVSCLIEHIMSLAMNLTTSIATPLGPSSLIGRPVKSYASGRRTAYRSQPRMIELQICKLGHVGLELLCSMGFSCKRVNSSFFQAARIHPEILGGGLI